MILSDISIKRPVFALVVNLIIVIAGIIAYKALPVREYPDVEVPVVSISTTYVGASPETIENTVTQPMEEVLHGIEGVKSISSISSKGHGTINVEFETYRDIDLAATDVNNVVQSALGKIPQSAEKPTISKSRANSGAFMWIVLQGDRYSPEELSNIADRLVKTPLQLISGVGSVIIGGEREYAMRIWLDPEKMAAKDVDALDIRRTILNSNLQLPAGKLEGETRQFDILLDAQIADPDIFANLIIRFDNGIPVYIKDVATVELGSANYHTLVRYNGKPVVGVGVVKQSKSNELKVSEDVKKELDKIKETLPKDILLKIAVDNSIFVNESLKEVKQTLIIAFIAVLLVTFLFLRSLFPTAIIAFAIPPSLIGAFAFMYPLGYSINVLTLLALVLAIGLVVDDAIVVLENIHRHQELGKSQKDAAVVGTREIGFPVIATTIALVAILVPLSMMTGYTGRLFKEFSIIVAVSVAISSFVALTLTPSLCSKYLIHTTRHGKFYLFLENIFNLLNKKYETVLTWVFKHSVLALIITGIIFVSIIGFFVIIPKTSVPTEDRGMFVSFIKAPQGSTLAYTNHTQLKVEKEISQIPEVHGYFSAIGLSIGGPSNTSNGLVFTRLKEWKERRVKQQYIVNMLLPKIVGFPGALAFAMNPPSLGQSALSKEVQFVIKSSSSDLRKLEKVSNSILNKLRSLQGLVNVDSDLLINNPQVEIILNREKIADLGIAVSDVLNIVQVLFSEGKINDFILHNKQYDVIASLKPKYRSMPEHINQVYIHGKNNEMIPLSSLVKIINKTAPFQISHYDLQRSVNVTANLAPGFVLGGAISEINKIAKTELPEGFSIAFLGESREFLETKAELYFVFAIALVFIYLVLASLFESFIHPFTILISVPLAVFGALATLILSGNTFNLYSAIGIIMLIGLVTKNSILIVEYSNKLREDGKEIIDAVTEACKVRLRPILMTSLTMILGTLPLVLATGAGAESRQPMGLAIVGGLSFSTLFTLFIIPVVYILFVKIAERFKISTVYKT